MIGSNSYEGINKLEDNRTKNIPSFGVGDRCFINNTIIDKDARIGNDVTINGGPHLEDTEEEAYVVKDGVVVIKSSSVIPNGFTL